MIINVSLPSGSYSITVERGCLASAAQVIMKRKRRVMIVSDDGVPGEYIDTFAAGIGQSAYRFIFKSGEERKTPDTLMALIREMLSHGFTRDDAVVALGGGVVGDIAGFAASIYMRGIDFYNIPSTLLSQVDASVGGKTAVDIDGYKNMIGSFWQPRAVFIDPSLLSTLPMRHISNGLCEALKISLTSDKGLFDIFERNEHFFDDSAQPLAIVDEIITRAVCAKRDIVEADEREGGIRRVLNFGHTIAHAIESATGLSEYLHGECVALGMIPMCSPSVRERLLPVLKKLNLPYALDNISIDCKALAKAIAHDKKTTVDGICTVFVHEVGKYSFETLSTDEITERIFR